MSKIYDWKVNIDEKELNDVVLALKNKGLIVFPTETVYGIGTDALDGEACMKIFEAKGRPSDNPLIVHVSDRKMLNLCVKNISDVEEKLIKTFMPGPFTLILEKKDCIPYEVTAGLETVAIRMPDNVIANKIIASFGKPIAAPSANESGKPSGTRLSDIKDELGEKVYALIDGGSTDIGLESTVVRVMDNVPVILRPGKVTAEDILKTVGCVKIDDHVLHEVKSDEKVLSPGMKHKHYSPQTKCVLVDAENDIEKYDIFNYFKDKNVCVLGVGKKSSKILVKSYINLGNNLEEVSKNIFADLREADKSKYDLILIEAVPADGIGLAIMNRVIRTCGYNVIKSIEQLKES